MSVNKTDYSSEIFQEKMWIEIIQSMEYLYGELADNQARLEKKNEELKKAYEELKTLQTQLIHSEKLASIGRLAAGVAHEINNPLTGILTFAHFLLFNIPDDDIRKKDVEVIIRRLNIAG